MQDRYVGDVGDFAKYALLRRLAGRQSETAIQMGIVWCVFPDETHNNDGRHISYLDRPDFQSLDDYLLAALKQIVSSGRRSIRAVHLSKIFSKNTVYCDSPSGLLGANHARLARIQHRSNWLDACFRATRKCELVFFDPDNGIEAASVAKHHPKGAKYVYWDELLPFWERGQTLLVYHHLNRTKPSIEQIRGLQSQIKRRCNGAEAIPLVFRRGSARVFWLIHRDNALGREMKRRAQEFLSDGWRQHFRPEEWSRP